MYGVVLAGGGARGAYEVGALKAIKEEGIKVGAICGSSIGAINAAIFAQGDFEKCENIWRNVTPGDVVDMSLFSDERLFSIKNIGTFIDEMRRNNGISMTPLEKMLNDVISEEKLILSSMDFGLVTYSLSENEVIELFKCDIPRGRLIDYLMASSALPGVRARVIDNVTYIDGGMGDNKPIGMLVNKGYRDIIAVDVGGVGVVRPYTQKGVNLIEVKCTSPIVGVLNFDNNLISTTIDMGYIDMKRAFGRLCGEIYSFKTNDYFKARQRYSKAVIVGLEEAADIFEIDKYREYTVELLAENVINEFLKYSNGKSNKKNQTKDLFLKACKKCLHGENDIKIRKKHSNALNSLCYFIRHSTVLAK